MDWRVIVLLLIACYALIAAYLYTRKVAPDTISFYGPILAIKSHSVGIFDSLTRFRRFLRAYGTTGVVVVAAVSVFITVLLFISLQYTLIFRPPPTGIYEPQNIFLLPGINDYVPSTFAVWFAFIITIVVHEFGHGILCRVEGLKVRSMGVLVAVIPIGFFVEPDEEELEKARGIPKARIFGAGISNNIVIGLVSFFVLALLIGFAIPATTPIVHGEYKDYPAAVAGIPLNSVIRQVNGVDVHTPDDVARILNSTKPGDAITVQADYRGQVTTYRLTLSAWPNGTTPMRDSGFMGIYYYPATTIAATMQNLASPTGFVRFIAVPFDMTMEGRYFQILAFDVPEQEYYGVPLPWIFWGLVHLSFWCAWININVGIFNAIPMIPLDGGYIMKEGVDGLLRRWGVPQLSRYVVGLISWLMLTIIVALIALPYLLHL
ncbi:MAG: site-2 protease family protein [Methanomicrobiales archaeon]|nr:site-2 protease family protein [Methanomicrobiales archaeon]